MVLGPHLCAVRAWVRVMIETKADRIVAARLFVHAGEEPVLIFGLSIKHGITAGAIYGFPTCSADVKSML